MEASNYGSCDENEYYIYTLLQCWGGLPIYMLVS